ncbi:MAG: hypothetical protein WC610_02455 [Patescibacteria group bacterium]
MEIKKNDDFLSSVDEYDKKNEPKKSIITNTNDPRLSILVLILGLIWGGITIIVALNAWSMGNAQYGRSRLISGVIIIILTVIYHKYLRRKLKK